MHVRDVVPGRAPAPRNAWYVAAFSGEVTATPMHRRLLGLPVVLFRDSAQRPVALFDRCPHRGYPLSAGMTCGDTIECGYHGLQFDARGRCVHVPSGDPNPTRMTVASYPVAERWQLIWIWTGDPAAADPALIPDERHYGFGCDGWVDYVGPVLPVRANYLLPFENLLDATHISFLHRGQLDTGNVAAEEFQLSEIDGRILVARTIRDEKQAEITVRTFALDSEVAHRTITAEAYPPNLCGIRIDIEPVGGGAVATNQLIVAITPQDDTSCLQFLAVAQSFPFQFEQKGEALKNLLSEDVVAMERIQALHDSLPVEMQPEYGLPTDKAAYRARRLIADLLEAEADGPVTVGAGR